MAARLSSAAHSLFPRLASPAGTGTELLNIAWQVVRQQWVRFTLWTALFCSLQWALPLAANGLFGELLPAGNQHGVMLLMLAMVAFTASAHVFAMLMSITQLSIDTRLEQVLQTAVWERVLRLPLSMLGRYQTGDLAARANSIIEMRRQVGLAPSLWVISIFTALFNVVLMVFLAGWLGLLVSMLVWGFYAAVNVFTLRAAPQLRQRAEHQAQSVSFFLQMMHAIGKLKVANAEVRATARWHQLFLPTIEMTYRTDRREACTSLAAAEFPTLLFIGLFVIEALHAEALNTSMLIALNLALGQMTGALGQITHLLPSLLEAMQTHKRSHELYSQAVEDHDTCLRASTLSGAITLEQLRFSYDQASEPSIKDIDLHIPSGQFVAIVGPSGSGKTTLVRLLLGFERPSSGRILFDEQNLQSLDLTSVRQQIGVVLQQGGLISGSIFHNIAASVPIDMNAAWEAARLAGLEQDIRAMPMGMHTMVSEDGETFSGGQRQRIALARALVHKPRILIFDEATSALDNTTQAIISTHLAVLGITRIVIAHRLSTIQSADHIVVMCDGRIQEAGLFQQLIERHGLFAALAERQLD